MTLLTTDKIIIDDSGDKSHIPFFIELRNASLGELHNFSIVSNTNVNDLDDNEVGDSFYWLWFK